MDIATIVGLILGIGLIGGSMLFTSLNYGLSMQAFWNLESMMIVLGGTLSATAIAFRLNDVKSVFGLIKFVFQNKPHGTGDAVLKTKKLIKGRHFLMLLPDDLIIGNNCSKRMISIHNKYKSSVIASMNVNKNKVSRWGILKVKRKLSNNETECESTNCSPGRLDDFFERPLPHMGKNNLTCLL